MSVKTKTATRIDLPSLRSRGTGEMRLYRLDPPLEDSYEDDGPFEYVIVSATIAPFSGPETYIFAADEAGEVTSWSELDGSYRGRLDHEAALNAAGYEVQS